MPLPAPRQLLCSQSPSGPSGKCLAATCRGPGPAAAATTATAGLEHLQSPGRVWVPSSQQLWGAFPPVAQPALKPAAESIVLTQVSGEELLEVCSSPLRSSRPF